MLLSECSACGHRRKFRNLNYDQQLRAYCASPAQCVKHHPNSIRNVQNRGSFIELLDYEDAQQIMLDRNAINYEQSAKDAGKTTKNVNLHRLVTGAISFRLKTDIQAEFITYMMGKTGSKQMNSVILDIIEMAMESDSTFMMQHAGRAAFVSEIKNPTTPATSQAPKREEEERKPAPIYTRMVDADEGEFVL